MGKTRFNEGHRLVSGALPVTKVGNIVLVSSRQHKNKWVLPKGGWESHETAEDAAQREAYEEAGIRGRIVKKIGEYSSPEGKRPTKFQYFVLEVLELLEEWPESTTRTRCVVDVETAKKMLLDSHPHMGFVIQGEVDSN